MSALDSVSIPPAPSQSRSVGRIARLAIKELREILRDRRTLLTLVLMPFLLYPLFSLVIRKFLLTEVGNKAAVVYIIGCGAKEDASFVDAMLLQGRPLLASRYPQQPVPSVKLLVADTAEQADVGLQHGEFDVLIRVTKFPARELAPNESWEADCEFVTVQGSLIGERAARYLEDCFRVVGVRMIAGHLRQLGVKQRASPIRATRVEVKSSAGNSAISLSALVPFVLVLMTITGAVYPAIDLTAGERERGTLELLIAAPVPRLGLLFAKYVAVLVVAMLTATINLVAMTMTVKFSGLGPMLWGERGLTWMSILAIFALLFLLASLFSAVLLAITSFARSFKEAQAYLIPVMLCALGPGLISLMPGVELQGWMLVTPLLNVALLSRDVLAGDGSWLAAVVVICATAIYAFAALAVAAKLFAADAVLYDARIGWGDLWQRPVESSEAGLAQALLCLACMFPVSFAALGGLSGLRDMSMSIRFALMAVATAIVYGGVPLLFAHWQRVDWATGLNWRRPAALSCLGAALLGLSLWPFAHEIVILSQNIGFASLGSQHLERAKEFVEQVRLTPPWLVFMAIAMAPAVFEEFCFRGFIFSVFAARMKALTAILVTGLLFGVFHLVTSDALAVERLLPSTVLGCVLGWVCWRTGSVFPGMLLHVCHNGLLTLLIYYQPELKQRGWGIEEREHFPIAWLAIAAGGCLVGAALVHFRGARFHRANQETAR